MPRKDATAYAFLDTNIFLQFRLYDEIDWPDVLGYRAVCLVISTTVVWELDGFKYDTESRRRQERSRQVTRKFDILKGSAKCSDDFQVPGRANVRMRFLTDSPDVSQYRGLRPENKDDQIIAAVLSFLDSEHLPEGDEIVLVSGDTGIRLKAAARGITCFAMPEKFRLPDEPTPEKKENAQLKRQIAELKNREPRLHLAFAQAGAPVKELRLDLDIIPDPSPEEIERLCEAERAAIAWPAPEQPKAKAQTTQTQHAMAALTASELEAIVGAMSQVQELARDALQMAMVPDAELKRYREDTTRYLHKYRRYLILAHRWRTLGGRTRQVDLEVINEGTAPATGVIIGVILPDGLGVHDPDLPPEQPERPSKPMTQVQLLTEGFARPISIPSPWFPSRQLPSLPDPDEDGPDITPYHSLLLTWKRSKVVHSLSLRLNPVQVLFPAETGEHHYEIRYKLIADNVPKPVEGKLILHTSLSEKAV